MTSQTISKKRGRRLGSTSAPEIPIFQILPKTKDPALLYLAEQALFYGYDPKDRVVKPEMDQATFKKGFKAHIKELVRQLLPGLGRADICRLFNLSVHNVNEALGYSEQSAKPDHCRILLLHLLVHIQTIKETLADQERELWLALMKCNDPRMSSYIMEEPPIKRHGLSPADYGALRAAGIPHTPPVKRPPARERQKQHRKRVQTAVRNQQPLPPRAIPPQIQPFRVLNLLGVQPSNSNPHDTHTLTPRERELKDIARRILRKGFLKRVHGITEEGQPSHKKGKKGKPKTG